ncbi:hypothetical protein LCGC14_0432570 [marine sediment metagenome]|uniref:Uncharacterized protein n=1 Tax=marine sediment metagenome TaxID=412755 RepID=A0A0F9VWX7_9ZZZZ
MNKILLRLKEMYDWRYTELSRREACLLKEAFKQNMFGKDRYKFVNDRLDKVKKCMDYPKINCNYAIHLEIEAFKQGISVFDLLQNLKG